MQHKGIKGITRQRQSVTCSDHNFYINIYDEKEHNVNATICNYQVFKPNVGISEIYIYIYSGSSENTLD